MKPEEKLRSYEQLALKIFRDGVTEHVEKVTAREGEDFRGDEALFFEMHLRPEAPADLGKRFIFSHLALRRALEAEDELRFPYLSTRRPSDPAPGDIILRYGDAAIAKRPAAR